MPVEHQLGSTEVTMSIEDLVRASNEMHRVRGERDRARALAAKLEEVVAMRTAVLTALVEWRGAMRDSGVDAVGDYRPDSLYGIIEWAKAQLEEVP